MNENSQSTVAVLKKGTWNFLKLAVLLGIIFGIWAASIRIIKQTNILALSAPNLMTILFGAASLALFVLSLAIAAMAIIGWKSLQDTISEKVNIAAKSLDNELQGRTLATMGYSMGEMSLEYKDGEIKVVDKERLSECLEFCQKSYIFLSRIGGKSEYMALNNLLYYSLMDEKSIRADWLLEKAEDLLKAGQKHNQPNLVLTACGVILEFSRNEQERDNAIRLLANLKDSEKISQRMRTEAKHYLNSVSAKAITSVT